MIKYWSCDHSNMAPTFELVLHFVSCDTVTKSPNQILLFIIDDQILISWLNTEKKKKWLIIWSIYDQLTMYWSEDYHDEWLCCSPLHQHILPSILSLDFNNLQFHLSLLPWPSNSSVSFLPQLSKFSFPCSRIQFTSCLQFLNDLWTLQLFIYCSLTNGYFSEA